MRLSNLVGICVLFLCTTGCICVSSEVRPAVTGPGYSKPLSECVACVRVGETEVYATGYATSTGTAVVYAGKGQWGYGVGTERQTVSMPTGVKNVPTHVLRWFMELGAFKEVTDNPNADWDVILTSEERGSAEMGWFGWVQAVDLWLHTWVLPTIPYSADYYRAIKVSDRNGNVLRIYEVTVERAYASTIWGAIWGDDGNNFRRECAELAVRRCTEMLAYDLVGKTALGVRFSPTTHASGLQIEEIVPDSPAAKAGLQRGDVITHLDGERAEDVVHLHWLIAFKKPGDKVTVKVIRGDAEKGGEERDIEVVLGERENR